MGDPAGADFAGGWHSLDSFGAMRDHHKGHPAPEAVAVPERSVPTKEIGVPANLPSVGILPWSSFYDDREFAPDLVWPASVPVYARMQTDAQIAGLLLATTLPVRRFRWEIDPNGARPNVVAHVAETLRLPIRGEDPPPRRFDGFQHDRHLAYALQALAYGFFYFERTYEIGADGLARLVKLGTRPPRTIVGLNVDKHGDLLGIEQNTVGGVGVTVMGGAFGAGEPIPRSHLLTYIWAPEDDGDWLGRSILRSCWRDWLVKDRLIRVDATKHERNGMGIPWMEVDPKASKAAIQELAAMAQEIRASTRGGGAGPGKLHLKGVEGSLPDTIGSIRYHDEQMAKSMLLLFFNLGGDANSGARSLAESFIDWYTEAQGAIADWYVEGTQAQIEDEVRINWGREEQPPMLTYTRVESAELAFADLAEGVKSGLIVPGEELDAYVRERFRVPLDARPDPPTPSSTEPPELPQPEDPTTGESVAPPEQPVRAALAEDLRRVITAPMAWSDAARAIGTDPKNGTARRAREALVAEGAIGRGTGGRVFPMAGLQLPTRELRRNPQPFEVEAAVNFEQMEATYVNTRQTLVNAVRGAQTAQVEEVRAAVLAADGDAEVLAEISVAPVDASILVGPMKEAARDGEASARAEHDAQVAAASQEPVAAAEPSTAAVDEVVETRAAATAKVLAQGFGVAASKRACALANLPAAEAAAQTVSYLEGLSTAALEEQLGGATMQAYNTGRRAYMAANNPTTVYASEILDANTCTECASIDGTEWATVADAEGDYPIGGYVNCQGGLRCRGTLVSVY